MTEARDGLVELTPAEAGDTQGGGLWDWLFGTPSTGFQFGGGGGFGGGGAGGSW